MNELLETKLRYSAFLLTKSSLSSFSSILNFEKIQILWAPGNIEAITMAPIPSRLFDVPVRLSVKPQYWYSTFLSKCISILIRNWRVLNLLPINTSSAFLLPPPYDNSDGWSTSVCLFKCTKSGIGDSLVETLFTSLFAWENLLSSGGITASWYFLPNLRYLQHQSSSSR